MTGRPDPLELLRQVAAAMRKPNRHRDVKRLIGFGVACTLLAIGESPDAAARALVPRRDRSAAARLGWAFRKERELKAFLASPEYQAVLAREAAGWPASLSPPTLGDLP